MNLRMRFRRWFASEEEVSAQEVQSEMERIGARAIADCRAGEKVLVTGHVRSMTLRPRRAVSALEAEVFDGTGLIRVLWLGRRSIGGIEPGRMITVSGRLVVGKDAIPTIFNPRYELRPRAHR
jgi:RecG-like helicase